MTAEAGGCRTCGADVSFAVRFDMCTAALLQLFCVCVWCDKAGD